MQQRADGKRGALSWIWINHMQVTTPPTTSEFRSLVPRKRRGLRMFFFFFWGVLRFKLREIHLNGVIVSFSSNKHLKKHPSWSFVLLCDDKFTITTKRCALNRNVIFSPLIKAAFLYSCVSKRCMVAHPCLPVPTGGSGWLNSETPVSSVTQGSHNRLIINEWVGPRLQYICTARQTQCNGRGIRRHIFLTKSQEIPSREYWF